MKKFLIPAIILLILVQILVPVYMIMNKYDTLKNGEEFKFKVEPIDPYDAFRGRYVWISADLSVSGTGKYGIIQRDSEGFARVNASHYKPAETTAYIKSKSRGENFVLPIDRYYMDEKLAPEAERLTRTSSEKKEAYITVRVKNGNMVISGLFINGEPIEDIIKRGL